jgi:hypothetical protein
VKGGVSGISVTTNQQKDSVCKVGVQPVTFKDLWAAYPSSPPYVDPKTGKAPPGYSNQCAIRVSVAIHGAGVAMNSFSGSSKIMVGGKNTAALASELAAWLKKQPFCGLPQKPDDVTGAQWEGKVKGRTGIVYFADYWKRTAQEKRPSGDHIDLWNGSRLTAVGASVLSTAGRYLGINAFFPGTDYGYSDLRGSSTILFWEIG